jgi:hypothetical protein
LMTSPHKESRINLDSGKTCDEGLGTGEGAASENGSKTSTAQRYM